MMMGNNDAKNLSLSHFLISFLVVCFSSSFFFCCFFSVNKISMEYVISSDFFPWSRQICINFRITAPPERYITIWKHWNQQRITWEWTMKEFNTYNNNNNKLVLYTKWKCFIIHLISHLITVLIFTAITIVCESLGKHKSLKQKMNNNNNNKAAATTTAPNYTDAESII